MGVPRLSRRRFLQAAGRMAALMGMGAAAAPRIAGAMADLAKGRAPVLWLQGQSCSGCSVSLLNSDPLRPYRLLTGYIALQFHQNLSTAAGELAMRTVARTIEKGGYHLLVEGAVPAGMPEACHSGGEPFEAQLSRAARSAEAVIAVGTCACHGGIPAAEGNPTGASSVPDFLRKQGIQKPCISIPGCPAHPDWITGTVIHALKFGLPPLDELGRPVMFFGKLVHDECQRFYDYERKRFARSFSDEGCLFKLGCVGTITRADCTMRLWNSGTSMCTIASGPCIGCASPHFAAKAGFPLYPRNR